ncbi:MAG TPA: ECF transporter S component, partial [Ferruginibacter sp.]|nr:ECF transporter S component [Ferruginibacter sp.]
LVASYHEDYTLFNPLFLNISWANILLGLVVVIPLLFATKFGPWVGLACFLLGSLIADSFSQARTDFEIPWYTYASLALLGFLSGLAFLRTQGYYHTRRSIATAVIFSFIGLVVDALFFMIVDIIVNPSSWFDSFSFYLKSALISILALMVLAIMLIISNKIERRNIPTG